MRGRNDQAVLENDFPYADNRRGIGPSEMAAAIAEGRPNRVSKEQALHVLDVIQAMIDSSKTGSFLKVTTPC